MVLLVQIGAFSTADTERDFDTSGIGKLYQDDIILTPEQYEQFVSEAGAERGEDLRKKRQVFRGKDHLKNVWGETIYYQFDPHAGTSLKEEFRSAAKTWEQDTCINFKESYSANEGLYITPQSARCASHVGKIGGWQGLYLGRGCESFGKIAHELGHALGLVHTVSRHDRDKYIMVDTINIKKEYAKQFIRQNKTVKTYGLGYDHGSIMHYRQRSGLSNDDYLIIPFDSKYKNTLGSEMISFADLTMINRHYNCTDGYKKCHYWIKWKEIAPEQLRAEE
ncbi:astacin [Ancylostoma caninum]|uniref:Metalloendopeptidase n=1 Tax=Ancylostoma caninum TaxID=29170 RepID=A0A368GWV2_ANCCA|nr:astacin [Ancylostoma caninum]